MTTSEVIDISAHAQRLRKRRLRRRLRLLVPIVCLLVMIGAIASIAVFSYTQNRRDALALSNSLVKSLDDRITARVAAYLQPVAKMVTLSAGVLNDTTPATGRRDLEPLAFQVLRTYPQIVAFSVGDPDGNFLMVKKMPDGALDTKTIVRQGTQNQASWVRRDKAGDTRDVERYANDPYDPRKRPWYTGALETDGVYWTEVYIFFTDQKPGVTAATAVRGPDGRLRGVLSMDVLLEELSTFLAGLTIGETGQALIIEPNGRLVAMQAVERMLKREDGKLRPARVEELGDPLLTRAFNRFRVEGQGIRSLFIDGRDMISTVSALGLMAMRDWSVMIVVPEEDFIGFVERNVKKGLMLSVIVVGLAIVLVSLLIFQGLRADRNAQSVLEKRRQFEDQSRAFSDLANDADLFGSKDGEAVARLTEIVAGAVGVRRVSVWRVEDGEDRLFCEDAWDRESGGHTQGTVLDRSEFPDLLAALLEGDDIAIADAATDPRTAELHRAYLNPLGSQALLAVPVRLHDRTVGGLWFEGQSAARNWSEGEITFARAIAGLLALRRENLRSTAPSSSPPEAAEPRRSSSPRPASDGEAPPPSPPDAVSRPIIGGRANRFYDRLAARGLEGNRLAADVFPNVTVFVLQFSDHLTLAEQVSQGDHATAMDHLVSLIETMAATHDMDYLKIMSDEIVGAAGFGSQANGAGVRAVTDFALDLQDRCRQVFADLDATMGFRVGLDTGPVIGSVVGEKQDYYNLWGDAVRTAAMLAENGVLGGIQVSESVYRRLRSGYVFQKRGTFYLADAGEMTTYLLTGRL